MVESSNTARRTLAAVVAADIVGYSRLMGIDEDHTIATLRNYRETIFQPLMEKHHGRLANTAGDSYFIEFKSATDAVRFAMQVQDEVSEKNLEDDEHLNSLSNGCEPGRCGG
ncbi:MAG: adenylate cyclase [Parasphingorhabdus sp.]